MTKKDDTTTTTSTSKTPKKTIDDAFQLLQEGKKCKSEGKNWDAAQKLSEGREILMILAQEQPRTTAEEDQIAQLYEQKSREYFVLSRTCLIDAMTKEAQDDQQPKSMDSPYHCKLSEEEAQHRLKTFCSLFSQKVALMDDETEENLTDLQFSIEERLQELNASLPSGFKTEPERMDSINRGLNRLGLSLYAQKEPFARFKDELPKDEDEQVADIINQATDEVAVEKTLGPSEAITGKSSKPSEEDEDDDDSEISEIEIDKEDFYMDDEQLAIKKIRRKVVSAQAKLAELVALLDEAKTAKQDEEEEKDIKPGDDNDDSSVVLEDADEYLSRGKKKLKGAQKDLRKSLQEWTEAFP